MNKQFILDEIKRTTEANGGKPLGKSKFESETGIRESDWSGKCWVRWSDAIKEAGFTPNRMQSAYDDKFLIESLASLCRELGHFPVRTEMKLKRRRDNSFPSYNVFRRLGTKSELVSHVLNYCEQSDEWTEVAEICRESAAKYVHDTTNDENGSVDEIGFVYLIKSGKYYKIGRSNSVGRREYELSIQLPEPVTLIHTIRTDDPVGIEEYWHKRFAEMRKGGEWFGLSASDIKSFKRRKFM